MRPLASTDYDRGHLDVLQVLTVVTDLGERAWVGQFNAMRAAAHSYYPIVIVDKATDQLVAVGTVFIERKFVRGLGSVGHIEDIAVKKDQQGRKLGLRIIQALTGISEAQGCYKTILNCSDSNIRKCQLCPTILLQLNMMPCQHSMRSVASKRKRMKWPNTLMSAPAHHCQACFRARYSPCPTPTMSCAHGRYLNTLYRIVHCYRQSVNSKDINIHHIVDLYQYPHDSTSCSLYRG